MSDKNKVEVCFSPLMYPLFENPDAITIVVDILRASTSICTAFMNEAEAVIPVGTLEEAMEYKKRGFLVAAERDGIVRDFADFGNSPFNFTRERVSGKQIVYSTTNGTQAITLASSGYQTLIGSFLNISAIVSHLKEMNRDVLVLCAGWKNKFNLEDSLFAGAIVDQLTADPNFHSICDSSQAARDLWLLAKDDLLGYVEKAAQRHRLKKNGLDNVLEYCHSLDLTDIIPVLKDQHIVRLNS